MDEVERIKELRELAATAQSRGTLLEDESRTLLEKAKALNWVADQLERSLLLA